MWRVIWFACCAVLGLAVLFLPTTAASQDLFGPAGGEGTELTPEPTPALDPGPGGELALPANPRPPAGAPDDLCRCVGDDSLAPSVVNIRQVLRQPLKAAGLDYTEQPLEEVVGLLQEEYGIPIKLDTAALKDVDVAPDKPVTVNLHGISLRAALRLMLRELGLTYIIQDEILMITTPDEAEQQLKICVYDVRDLISSAKTGGTDALVDTIISCVAAESWAENGGGEAEVRRPRPGLLVISQTQAVHEEIRDLLETIRRVNARHPAGHAAPHAAMGFVPPAADNADDVVTRSYLLQINQPADAKTLSSQIRELITLALHDEQWAGRLDDGQPVVLTVLPDRIVLRHRQSVQEKVRSLLSDSGIASPAAAVAGEMGGGFEGRGFGGGGGGFFNPESAESQ